MPDPYRALRSHNFQLFSLGGLASAIGGQIFATALSWEIYERTRDPGALGLLGLLQVVPVLTLALPAGDLADRTDRRKMLLLVLPFLAACPLALGFLSRGLAPLPLIYGVLLLESILAALVNPARQAILPQLVDDENLPNAIAWNSSRWQIASTLGPALGGWLVAVFHAAWPVYMLASGLMLIFWACAIGLKPRAMPPRASDLPDETIWQRLAAGGAFVARTPLILATITLDMLAVLLGGAVALLPVYAKEILHTDAVGLGWLRAAPAAGALVVGLYVAYRSPLKRAGLALLWAVAGFGLATVVFGFSRSFPLSLAMLALTGACDNISVVVRHTLVQALTPHHMQGRVSAVHSVFIGVSNELGAAESGYLARAIGPIPAVVFGGIGTVVVVLIAALRWPQMKALGSLDSIRRHKE